jgi:chloramphenicol O-acetyltransferase type A
MTANVDVTDFAARCKEHGLKFYTAFICLMTKVLNSEEYFRFGYDKDGNVVIYDQINPFYTDSIDGSDDFNCIITDCCSGMKEMYEKVSADREKYKGRETLEPENMSDNIFSITAMPWVHYTHLSLNDASRPDSLSPSIALGKYEPHEGKLMLPLTIWIHHAVCDGFHVGRFFNETQRLMPVVMDEIING